MGQPGPAGISLSERRLKTAVGALLLVVAALHLIAVFRENVNWDEFAFFERARESLATGRLQGGGRPGLAVLFLLPFVRECEDAMTAVRSARLLWCGFTFAFLAALWVFVARLRRGLPHPWRGGALAVGLLTLVPVFLRWSLQVRTDQPALAAALWGGVALLASSRRPVLASLAGIGFALGYLCTEKAVYVTALAALAAIAQLADPDQGFDRRREGLRAAWTLIGSVVVLGAFRGLVSLAFAATPLTNVEGGMRAFDFYRRVLGFRVYRGMLPSLTPHLLLAASFAVASVLAWRHRLPGRVRLGVAGAMLTLGVAVGLFHAGAFPYFWMTLGVFPAAAFGVALEPTVGWIESRRLRQGVLAVVGCILVAWGLPAAVALLADTQRPQVESLAFVRRNFPPDTVGFHPEGALFCRPAPHPFPTYLTQHILSRFSGPDGRENVEAFLAEFRRWPVEFIVESYRLAQFPHGIRRFWAENYRPYRARVSIPAPSVEGAEGETSTLGVLVAGTYRWEPHGRAEGGHVVVDGIRVEPGASISLAAGDHTAVGGGGPGKGTLWLAVADPPAPSSEPFYSLAARAEFEGVGLR